MRLRATIPQKDKLHPDNHARKIANEIFGVSSKWLPLAVDCDLLDTTGLLRDWQRCFKS